MLHKNEMMLPASLAEGVRGMVAGGGAEQGNRNVTFKIAALDGADLKRVVRRNAKQMFGILEKYGIQKYGRR